MKWDMKQCLSSTRWRICEVIRGVVRYPYGFVSMYVPPGLLDLWSDTIICVLSRYGGGMEGRLL